MRLLLLFVAACLSFLPLPRPAAADPRAPVSVVPAPEDQGPAFFTSTRLIDSLPRRYVEQEYFVSGVVDVYRYGDPPVPGELILRDDVETAYTTRIVVRRPRRARHFNGTVVVEWFNSTAGFDSSPAWDVSADFFARRGMAYVGITVHPVAIAFLRNGCPLSLSLPCDTRYAALSMPEPGQSYEMVSQIVNLLRGDAPENPLPRRYRVQRLYQVGQSQQAADVTTYANEFHSDLVDGYFLQAGLGFGKPLSSGSPNFPAGDLRGMAPRDLPVPVIRAQTESDMGLLGLIANGTRQPGMDTPTFRYYEIAGMAHNVVHELEVVPAGVLGPDPVVLGDLCRNQPNTGADGPVFGRYVYDAIWRNLERQVRHGRQLPHAEPFQIESGDIVRDEFGNAVGGIRLPAISVPLARYSPSNLPKPACSSPTAPPFPGCIPPEVPGIIGLACLLSGSVFPFPPEQVAELYPRRWSYLYQVYRAVWQLREDGFLLPHDAREILARAREVDFGQACW